MHSVLHWWPFNIKKNRFQLVMQLLTKKRREQLRSLAGPPTWPVFYASTIWKSCCKPSDLHFMYLLVYCCWFFSSTGSTDRILHSSRHTAPTNLDFFKARRDHSHNVMQVITFIQCCSVCTWRVELSCLLDLTKGQRCFFPHIKCYLLKFKNRFWFLPITR